MTNVTVNKFCFSKSTRFCVHRQLSIIKDTITTPGKCLSKSMFEYLIRVIQTNQTDLQHNNPFGFQKCNRVSLSHS